VSLRVPPGLDWVVSDLDGTFLGADDRPSAANVAAVELALDAGLRFSFATGRLPAGLPDLPVHVLAHEQFGPHIVHNGAQVVHGAERLATFGLPSAILGTLLERCHEQGWYAEFYPDHGFIATHAADIADRSWREVTGPPEAIATRGLLESMPIIKATIVVTREESPGLITEIERLGLTAEISTSPIFPGADIVNVQAGGVSKGSALQWLAERLGTSTASALAIGDGLNDVTMLRTAGHALAVEYSPESLVAVADGSVPHVDGVAVAIHALLTARAGG
jgi:Cof subfamily protein (haloacid dehalogenase superfamily)